MIRQITNEVQKLEPPLLMYSKECRLHLNNDMIFKQKRRRLPIIVSQIAYHRDILQKEHRMARHILHRHHINFARPLVLAFLQFNY